MAQKARRSARASNKEISIDEYFRGWAAFYELITNRILQGAYPKGVTSFNADIGTAQLYQYRKKGLPEIFLTDVFGELPPLN